MINSARFATQVLILYNTIELALRKQKPQEEEGKEDNPGSRCRCTKRWDFTMHTGRRTRTRSRRQRRGRRITIPDLPWSVIIV